MRYDQFDKYADFPLCIASPGASWAELDQVAREISALNQKGQEEFSSNTEWNTSYRNDANAQVLVEFIDQRGLPTTSRNLHYAFAILKTDGLIVKNAPPAPEPELQPAVIARPHENEPTVEQHEDEITADDLTLIMNNPSRSDAERKEASKALKLLAVRDRITRSNLPRHYGEKCII